MPDIATLLAQAERNGDFTRLVRDPFAQFGTPDRPYLGATLLPEINVEANAFTEDFIRYRSVVANAGTRYSPVQIKNGALVGSFDVKLAESDIGSTMRAREYEALLRMASANLSIDGIMAATRWVDTTLNRPLIEWNERARWQAIVDASAQLRGDNEYSENVAYSNPAGHRVAAAAAWTNNATDPFLDIFGGAQQLTNKGYTVNRIISSRRVTGIMGANAIVRTRTGSIRIDVGGAGALTRAIGRASRAQINAALQEDGLPPIEVYDLQYSTMTGQGRFLADTVMVLIATTGRDQALDLAATAQNAPEILQNTLGYVGVGRAAGQTTPGRVTFTRTITNTKPPRVEGEAWQTSLPVITEPEAIFVITGIA